MATVSKQLVVISVLLMTAGQTAIGNNMTPQDKKVYFFKPQFLKLRGCILKNDRIYPGPAVYQENNENIWLEAEDFSLAGGKTVILAKPTASGGKCIASIQDAEYPLIINKPGKYYQWARVHFTSGQKKWPHTQSVDNAPKQKLYDDIIGTNVGKWLWLKGGSYDFTKGLSIFRFDLWPGSNQRVKIDKLLFTCDPGFIPRDMGEKSVRSRLSGIAEIETYDYHPSSVIKWMNVNLESPVKEYTVYYSADSGSNWRKVVSGKTLSGIKTGADGKDKIRFKLVFEGISSQTTPLIEELRLEYISAPDGIVSISNGVFTIGFDRQTGILRQLKNKKTSFICEEFACYPFKLYYRNPKEKIRLLPPPDKFVIEKYSKDFLAGRYAFSDWNITVRVTLKMTELVCECHIEVTNDSQNDLVGVEYPFLPVTVGETGRDDILIYPRVQGDYIENPVNAGGAEYFYPGRASMQWMDIYDKQGGLYLASYDKTIQGTSITALPFPIDYKACLGMSFKKHKLITPGTKWCSEPYAAALHDGDWHWGADRYREWCGSWMLKPSIPAWVRASDGWMGWMLRDNRGSFRKQFSECAAVADELGLRHLEFWGQMMKDSRGRVGGNDISFLPDPDYGTEADFSNAIAELLKNERKYSGFYINPSWFPEAEFLARYKDKVPPGVFILDDPKKALNYAPLSSNGSRHSIYMCPSAQGWSEFIKFWTYRYIDQYKVSGLYLDCLGVTGAVCYDESHGHGSDIGAWGKDSLQMVADIKTHGRKENPDFFLVEEGVCDVYGQFVDMNLISACSAGGGWGIKPYPEMFFYTFPDYLLFDGFCNEPKKYYKDIIDTVFYKGHRFDFLQINMLKPEIISYAAKVLALRRKIKDFLYYSRFVDTVGLATSDPALRAKLF
ncbi:MAG: DUF6259 domain-containing protein, partial [Victivallaceae bacterium]|nr:DUF6259 domain-containing protein [Victivallaceae bacterium]